jgi:hypothetical protein
LEVLKKTPHDKVHMDKTPTRDLKKLSLKVWKKNHFERTYENKVQFWPLKSITKIWLSFRKNWLQVWLYYFIPRYKFSH